MKNQARQAKHSQSGNVMFIILIAIALFAALSYVLMKTSRSSGTISEERGRLAASEVMEYANAVKSGVKTLLINGCKDTELGFGNTIYAYNDNSLTSPAAMYTLAPLDGRCDMFNTNGANLRAVIMTSAQIPQPHAGGARTGNIIFTKAAIPGVGTSAAELLLVVPHVNKATCESINKMLNINNGKAFFSIWPGDSYNNSFTTGTVMNASLNGIQSGCFTNAAPEDPLMMHFYQVLIAR